MLDRFKKVFENSYVGMCIDGDRSIEVPSRYILTFEKSTMAIYEWSSLAEDVFLKLVSAKLYNHTVSKTGNELIVKESESDVIEYSLNNHNECIGYDKVSFPLMENGCGDFLISVKKKTQNFEESEWFLYKTSAPESNSFTVISELESCRVLYFRDNIVLYCFLYENGAELYRLNLLTKEVDLLSENASHVRIFIDLDEYLGDTFEFDRDGVVLQTDIDGGDFYEFSTNEEGTSLTIWEEV